jgi:putative phage-type endonuclease
MAMSDNQTRTLLTLGTQFGDAAEPVLDSRGQPAMADRRPDWLVARRSGIGASEAAAVMGLGPKREDGTPYRTQLEVYADKVAEGPATDHGSEKAHWGQLFEPVILEEFARRTERRVRAGGLLMRSRTERHLICTLDAETEVDDPGVIEIKTTGWQAEKWAEELPVWIQIQVQHQLLVTGATWATVVWLPFPERRLRWIEVERHESFQQMLLEDVAAFWKRVVARQMPNVDGSASAKRALQRLFPEDDGSTIQLAEHGDFGDWITLARELNELKEDRKQIVAREDEIKNWLAAAMGKAQVAELDDGASFTMKRTRDVTFNCQHCGKKTGERKGFRTPRYRLPPKSRRQLDAGKVDPLLLSYPGAKS